MAAKNDASDPYSFVADIYDHIPSYRERRDDAFYGEYAREANGPVLELGCGTGRVLIPCARSGARMTGLDSSPAMLDVLERKLAAEPREVQDRVTVRTAGLTDFNLDESFSLVTIPFRPFQHLVTVEDQMNCLTCVRKHLAPGGRFIFDIFNPSVITLASSETSYRKEGQKFVLPDGRQVVSTDRFASRDLFRQVNDIELIYEVMHPDGRAERVVHAFPMRYLFRYEVEHLLARCGLEVEAVYGDFAKTPFGETAYPGDLVVVARRND